jgi:putative aminopeptidase FrvX
MKDTIKKLVEAYGPSGHEDQVRDIIREEVKDLADDFLIDALGNLIVRMGEKSQDGLTLMLAAHMDEIGVMVSHIDEKGFARFTTIGGVSPNTLVGNRVRFADGTVGTVQIEQGLGGWRNKALDLAKMYIDIGATNTEDALVKVGDAACFFRQMDEAGDRLIAKSMDDRVSCAVLIETMRRLDAQGGIPHAAYFVFSVQEEVSLLGARTSAYGIDPDLGIAVDVTLTGDTPEATPMAVALGDGPAVKIMDSGMVAHPAVKELMVQRAQAAEIPYQLEVLRAGTTDARTIQLARAGVPSGCISIPCRHVHTPSEMVDLNDVQNAVKLLVAILTQPIALGEEALLS